MTPADKGAQAYGALADEFLTRHAAVGRNVAASIAAEAPILAHGNRADRSREQALDEIRGLHFREGHVETQRHEQTHAEFADDRRLVLQRRQKRGGRFSRRDHADRVRIEGQHSRQPASPCGGFHGPGDDCLVADVDAVENPQRKVQRRIEGREVFQAV
jgi:hypothetical protein